MALNIDKFLEPSEIGAGIAVPLGGCIPWLSPTVGSPEPTPPIGFEYCDGGLVTTGGSSLLGLAKPALMTTVDNPGASKRFVRGADTTVTYGGATALVTGGADTHIHTGSMTTTGDHNHQMQNHTHSLQNHTHTVNIISTDDINRVVFSPGSTHRTDALNGDENHQHTVVGNTGVPSVADTGAPSNNDTTNTGDHTHVLTVDPEDTTPAFVELAWIIRVL